MIAAKGERGTGNEERGENAKRFDALARLVCYPRSDYHEAVVRACELAADSDAEIPLGAFRDVTMAMTVETIEELYTQTFDLDPVAALDLGWHLWGDAYERGRFLATLREWLAECGIAENGELPDHLGQVLPLLARLDAKRATDLVRCVRPAIAKITESLGETPSVFSHLLGAVNAVLGSAFPGGDTMNEHAPMSIAGVEATPYEVSR